MTKILNLILYNNSSEYNDMRDALRRYLKSTGVTYFFYCYDENITSDYTLNDDIILIKGPETFLPGIFKKTIIAMEICLNLKFKFDYIIRSNISTIVDFTLLSDYLKKENVTYGGSAIFTLSWIDPAYGIYDHRYDGLKYIQGTGIVLSRKMVELIVNAKNDLNYSVIDDVGIGLYFQSLNISPQPLNHDYKFVYNADCIVHNALFYRNKRTDRKEDVKAMEKITQALMKKQSASSQNIVMNNKITSALYGFDKTHANVLREINENFVVNNKLVIPKNVSFNNVFGDPMYGQKKSLTLKINHRTIVLDEHRNHDVSIDVK
jgi:hypothetical protein